MNGFEEKIESFLVRTVPLPASTARDWEDVVRRSGMPARRLKRAYLIRRLVPAFVIAVAFIAVGLIAPWQHGRSFTSSAVAERALVAIGDGPVLHAVVRTPDGGRTYVDLATGQETPQLVTTEVWYDKDRRFVHRQDGINGHVFLDYLAKPFASGKPKDWPERMPYIPSLDPALAGFVDGYRSALENGDAHVTGAGTVDGHDVTWIELTFFGNEATERVAIDQASSLPIRIERVNKGKIEQDFDVVSIETLPEGSGNFSKPEEDVSPTRWLGRDQVTTISQENAVQALPGALWVGKSISALELSSVARARLMTQTNESASSYETGIELHYGDGSPGRIWGDESTASEKPKGSYVWLLEATISNPVYWTSRGLDEEPPAGSMLTDSGDREPYDGFMVKDGINITILASSPELVLAAARVLTPIRP